MGAIYDALVGLSSARDRELLDGYHRYDALLSDALTPAQLQTYADSIRQSGVLRIFEELTPDELAALSPEESAIATTILSNEMASMENRRVAALLTQRGESVVAPDLGDAREVG